MRFLWFLFLFGCCVVELTFRVNKSCLLINLSDFNSYHYDGANVLILYTLSRVSGQRGKT